jgi:hypothetical protein
MTIFVSVLLGLLGIALLIFGLGFFLVFRFALRQFDYALKADFAAQSKEQIERAIMKIRNPLVRRLALKHLVHTGGAITVSLVRSGLEQRKQTGLLIAAAGVLALMASFATPFWLPMIWRVI